MGSDESLLDTVRSRVRSVLPLSEGGDPVTVVSGLPRSGTSMMMQMLQAGGIEPLTDEERPPDPDNPEGYYELERVKDLPEGDTTWLDAAEGRAVKVISALLAHLPEGYRYQVVFMRRDIDEVLDSQRRMLERQGQADEVDEDELRTKFLEHLDEVQAWAAGREAIELVTIDYNAILEEPRAELDRLEAFFQQELDIEAMADVVDPELYRQRGDDQLGSQAA